MIGVVVALTQILFVVFPPMRALAVPPLTVLTSLTSVGNVAGHVDGVTTVGTEVPLVVFPLFHVILKVVPVELPVRWPLPAVIAALEHPLAVAPAVLPLRPVHVTIVGANDDADADAAGSATVRPAGTANDVTSARILRRIYTILPVVFRILSWTSAYRKRAGAGAQPHLGEFSL
ncbi:MAG: hypothetical protein J2P57_08135 [Acidimicrobiaceae bacterium]|nr:hypothetical protein [Acidimicrobiaceae bacterium]